MTSQPCCRQELLSTNLFHPCTLSHIVYMFFFIKNTFFSSPRCHLWLCILVQQELQNLRRVQTAQRWLPGNSRAQRMFKPGFVYSMSSVCVFWGRTFSFPCLCLHSAKTCRSTAIWRQTEAAGLWSKDVRSAWRPSIGTGNSTKVDLDPSVETFGWATTTSFV